MDSSTSLNFNTLIHQRFILELSNVFNQYIKSNCIPCEVDISPFDVFLTNKEDIKQCQNIVQTDISVICDGDKLNDKGCIGAPDGYTFKDTVKVDIYNDLEIDFNKLDIDLP
ncbi:Uma2 family endonuclease [Clostridium tyrobutyricum]|uniref:Uma2 family endonuclease n=1 Tax=Clostridium tyrobutyricum TaxID=1519 RepID=UPI0018AAA297|nr:Uma2 family endonuclease [Clostridium tyrobutyricum]